MEKGVKREIMHNNIESKQFAPIFYIIFQTNSSTHPHPILNPPPHRKCFFCIIACSIITQIYIRMIHERLWLSEGCARGGGGVDPSDFSDSTNHFGAKIQSWPIGRI